MFKLALNAGHGYNTAGKRCLKSIDPDETREYVLNKRICDKIEQKLKNFDDISLLRIDDGSELSITKRTDKANSFGADFYLAIHHNAGINGGSGGGIEAYVYLKTDAVTDTWQKDLYTATSTQTGLVGNRSQPLRRADLGECRQTAMPAVLLECGFMDSTADTPVILGEEFAERCADAIVSVIVSRAGLEKKQTASAEAPKKTDGEIADEVIKGLWGNGEDRRTRLQNSGYNYDTIQALVNERLTPKAEEVKKSTDEVANEVIKGLWGNGSERKQKLAAAGYDYDEVQKKVNSLLK